MQRLRRAIELIAAAAALGACGSMVPSAAHSRPSPPATHPLAPEPVLVRPATVPSVADPGALPQTTQLPSPNVPAFQQRIADLWNGIVADDPTEALGAFFPLSAYLQVKSLTDDGTDWAVRLVAHFVLDVEAAHAYIAAQGGSATFVGVAVPMVNANWVQPGVCYNRLGYWHVPGSRLVYRIGQTTYSIGIVSLISWRGQWYVVHLGAISRPSDQGYVDAPATGVGAFPPPGGC
jgi:hypothetical protein